MNNYNIIWLLSWLFTSGLYGQTITCVQSNDPWASINTSLELTPPGVNITLGAAIPDYTVLYTQDNVALGQDLSTCSKNVYLYHTILEDGLLPVKTISGDKIYPTDVPGIGISIFSINANSSFPVFPNLLMSGWTGPHTGEYMSGKIKLWKIPGTIPLTTGSVSVNGPMVGQVLSYPPNEMINSDGSSDRVYSNGQYYLASSRKLHASLIFQPGTCELEGRDIVVKMGDHPGVNGKNSPWKDASFKLLCSDAHGYGGASAMNNADQSPFGAGVSTLITANNNQQNGRVKLAIVPYTAIVNNQEGIIALDGTGATGYGIQLAWGDYATQSTTTPAKAVHFGNSNAINISDLNAQFRATSTPIDGNAFTGGDNTITMAARYIRTSGDIAPGPACASVEVIANYQ